MDGCHRLGGHRAAGLDEPYRFAGAPGRTNRIEEYEMILRLTFDNEAGIQWGSNFIYILIHCQDLAEERLERAVVTTANY